MTEKRGRGRPKGAPNKPKMELITERQKLMKNADVFEILCQAEMVAKENEDFAINGLKVFSETNGAVKSVLQWAFSDRITSKLPEGYANVLIVPSFVPNVNRLKSLLNAMEVISSFDVCVYNISSFSKFISIR